MLTNTLFPEQFHFRQGISTENAEFKLTVNLLKGDNKNWMSEIYSVTPEKASGCRS
jgi:hypothetical protein